MNALLVLLIASFAAAADAPAAAKADVDGSKIFLAKCASCHAKDGKGSAAMAKMFKADPKDLDLTRASDGDAAKVVTEGRKKMPAFKGKLKDAEITAVVAYIGTLKPKTK